MTSFWSRLGLTASMAAMASVGASATIQQARPLPAPRASSPPPARPAPRPPSALRDQINQLGRAFDGQVGIAVRSIDEGWNLGWKENGLYPQQSVSKLWVAITALDAADRGQINLDDQVTLTPSDLTVFHQPIAAKILGGSYTTSLGDLMVKAITTSDNTCNDKLMRSIGGPAAVRAMIRDKQLGSIRFYDGERSLQSRIAGLTWSPSYSIGRAFYEARNALPMRVRRAAFNRYIDDPYDGAAPSAIVGALARLKRGELLSPGSTARLLRIMGNTHTGPNRLKGGLKDGWTLSHKTGTGQVLGAVQAGYNDIGILSAPDGHSFSVAVMIKRTSTPLPVRMKLMNNVVRAVIDQHQAEHGDITL